MANRVQLPEDPKLAGKILDAQHAQAAQRIQRGAVGWLLGSGKEKPGNVAGLAILLACLMIILLAKLDMAADVPRKELIMLIAGIIPGALGYYFGFLTGAKSGDS